ncbi:unnamed protein product, partial [Brassica rapa subsp. trilocularis]
MLPEADEVVCVQLQTIHRGYMIFLHFLKPEFIVMLVAIRQKVKLEVATYFDKMTQKRPRKMMVNVHALLVRCFQTTQQIVISQEGNQQSYEFL